MSSTIILGDGGSIDTGISTPVIIPSVDYNENINLNVLLSNNINESLRGDGTWGNTILSDEILEMKVRPNILPFNQILYRNKIGDNNVSTDVVSNFTITAIDTVSHVLTVSDLPPGVDLENPSSGNKWVIMNVESWSDTTDPGYLGNCRAWFQVDSVNTTTKEISYTYYGDGWAESSNLVGHRLVFYNPFEDGFTRNPNNPIFEASDFSSLGTYTFISIGSYMWRQDGTFVLFILGTKTAGGYDMLYGTTTDFVTWTPGNSVIFSSRPTWATDYFLITDPVEYIEDEGVYFAHGKGVNASVPSAGPGWIKFSEDFSTYEISPDPMITFDEIDLFLSNYDGIERDGYGISNNVTIENNGVWYMSCLLFTKLVGTHTGANGVTVLEDINHYFEPGTLGMLNGTPIKNLTAATSGTITTNDLHTVTTNITWNTGDSYEISDVITRRSAIAVSDTKYGPFRLVSMIPARDDVNDGTSGSRWMQNNQGFVYKGNIYFLLGGTSKYLASGLKANVATDVFRFDPYTNDVVRLPSSPMFTGINTGDKFGYPEYNWEADHISSVQLVVDKNNNKLHILYDATQGSNNYKTGHAYKDLNTIL